MKFSSIKVPQIPIKLPRAPKSLDKLLHNKYVLYGCILLSLFSLGRFIMNSNMNALITFVIIGGLMTFFSKNMIIVLIIPLIIINLLFIKKNIFEGMNPTDTPTDTSPNDILINSEGDIFGGTAVPVCPSPSRNH